MQRGLINHRAGQQRVAVRFDSDGQTPEPVRPFRTQLPLDSDLVNHGLVWTRLGGEFVCHDATLIVCEFSRECLAHALAVPRAANTEGA